jgi:lysophospholipase L1-like esterase
MTPAKILIGVLGLVLLTAPGASAASRPIYQAPRAYYLALGDSMAYGFQPTKPDAPPSGFRTGYVDVFASRLRALTPGIKVVNYSCPGEQAKTFIAGECPWVNDGRRLHDAYTGSQLGAAVAFLRAHPGQVSPITLTMWGNDLFGDFAPACQDDLVCIKSGGSAGLARLGSRLDTIVGRLRAAAPKAEIILSGAWNFDVEHPARTDPLFRSIDATIARVAVANRARVAKIYPVFSPVGKPARAKAPICKLTFVCSRDDLHPTDAGYRAMAAAFLAASGYPAHS